MRLSTSKTWLLVFRQLTHHWPPTLLDTRRSDQHEDLTRQSFAYFLKAGLLAAYVDRQQLRASA
jgi:hypothetical protein